jgi:hypothetical protein
MASALTPRSALLLVAVFILLSGLANAQSTNKNNPTPLVSREVVGLAEYPIPKTGWAKTFYYVFTAGPGEMEVTVESWKGELTTQRLDPKKDSNSNSNASTPGRKAGGWFENRFDTGRSYAVTLNEYTTTHSHGAVNTSAKSLASIELIDSREEGKSEITKKFKLPEQTRIIMAVNLSGRFNYRIKLEGPVIGVDPRRNQ